MQGSPVVASPSTMQGTCNKWYGASHLLVDPVKSQLSFLVHLRPVP